MDATVLVSGLASRFLLLPIGLEGISQRRHGAAVPRQVPAGIRLPINPSPKSLPKRSSPLQLDHDLEGAERALLHAVRLDMQWHPPVSGMDAAAACSAAVSIAVGAEPCACLFFTDARQLSRARICSARG